MPPPPHRILRIGIILGGNIIEERLIRNRETVTVGQSSKNSFSVPIEGLPKSWPLFSLEQDKYVLQFTGNMDGRISAGGQVYPLSALRGHGAQQRGNYWAIALDERSRGKIVVGELTLLFQFVTAPPLQPRPRLPASVRGSLADRIDPQLAIIMALSVLLHFGLALYAYQRDLVMTSAIDEIHHAQFTEEDFKDRVDVTDVQVDVTGTEVAEVETEGTETEGDDKGGGDDKTPRGDGGGGDDDGGGAPDDAAIAEAIASTALVAAITAGEGEGSRYSKMTGTDQGAALDAAIEDASGKAVATRGTPGRTRGPGTGQIGGDKGSKVGGPKEGTGVGSKSEEKVSKIKLGGVDDLSMTDLDPEEVAKRIRSKYLAGIKRCHSQALKTDPNIGGRVTIRFTVGPTGRVTSAKVNGFDGSVDACIQGLASKWRFAAPKEDGKPVSADFQIPLILKPGS